MLMGVSDVVIASGSVFVALVVVLLSGLSGSVFEALVVVLLAGL